MTLQSATQKTTTPTVSWETELEQLRCQACGTDFSHCAQLRAFLRTKKAEWEAAARREGREEERQFILNVLDGIDVADVKMQNTGGGTKAIRFALASRPVNLNK